MRSLATIWIALKGVIHEKKKETEMRKISREERASEG